MRTTRLRTNEAVSLPFLQYPQGLPERVLINGPASAQPHFAEQLFSFLELISTDTNCMLKISVKNHGCLSPACGHSVRQHSGSENSSLCMATAAFPPLWG